ncbi:ATP-binding protein [Simiduia curdlanivorans]|uniref:ATP-binding protein n=1 Tax=Simiduia curdlanivorans TaxID=1492769 RepID=A0ABV8V6R8_9GAMM|nr:ATP-binding protein [Simiduia curdlanivorans]MDN3638551.1 ATP-binding protein [Simiduia curdlanivorans]
MKIAQPEYSPRRQVTQNLRTLVLLRWMLLTALLLSLSAAYFKLNLVLEYQTLLWLIGVFFALNLLTHWRIQSQVRASNAEFMAQLTVDIIGLSTLLYFTGGATNPFVSYLLIPLCIAAIALPARLTFVIAALCIGCYWWLLSSYIPVQNLAPTHPMHHAPTQDSSLHIYGMWLNFVFSAGIIATFLSRMARELREQDQIIQNQREHVLRSEQLTAIATLAAGAAHELGTPLTTIKIAAKDIMAAAPSADIAEDAAVISAQIDACQNSLRKLRDQAEAGMHIQLKRQQLKIWLEHTIDQWQLINPQKCLAHDLSSLADNAFLNADTTLTQSLINLMNNAAEQSEQAITLQIELLHIDTSSPRLQLDIIDFGGRIAEQVKQQWGQPFNSNKAEGLGLGVYLSNSTIERHQGKLILLEEQARKITRIDLPIIIEPSQ